MPSFDTLQSLQQTIESQYEISTAAMKFGDVEFNFTRVADPETVLDDETMLMSHEELEWQPYWAETWDSASGFCSFLVEEFAGGLQGRSVLDIGCGMGLTGCVAAGLGASVTMVDFAPPALLFAELNAWPWRQRVQVQRVDWCVDDLQQKFDIVIASDILYDRSDLPHLDTFIRKHLIDGATAYLGEPNRIMGNEFIQWFKQHGWNLTQHPVSTPHLTQEVRVLQMQPQG